MFTFYKTTFICTFILLVGCQIPTSSHREISTTPDVIVPPEQSTAKGVELDMLAFPIWWSVPSYETGGSPVVVVFYTNGTVYSRSQSNEVLVNAGKWTYDSTKKEFSVFSKNGIFLENTTEGVWDKKVYLGTSQLVTGSPDYTASKIAKKWIADSGVTVYTNGWVSVPMAEAIFEHSGKIRLAVGGTQDDLNWTLQWISSLVPETWSISPMGDKVNIIGGKGGGLRIEYRAQQLVLVAQYYEKVQGLVAFPPATQPDIYVFGGLMATLSKK